MARKISRVKGSGDGLGEIPRGLSHSLRRTSTTAPPREMGLTSSGAPMHHRNDARRARDGILPLPKFPETRMHLSSLSHPLLSLVAAAAVLCAADRAPAAVYDACMEDAAGFGLNCTANDIQLAGVTNVVVLDDGCAFPGDTVTFDATVELLLTAQARHDVGIYFATDAGDALNGSCLVDTLPFQPDLPFLDLDGTGDDPGGVIQDTCGDIDESHNPIFSDISGITVTCVDKNGDGKLDLPNCLSWRQPGANDLCTSPLDAYPGAPSKCRCGSVSIIDIAVPPGAVRVTKTASPSSVNEPGAPVTFQVLLENPSTAVLTIDTLVDNIYGDLDGQGTCSVPQTIFPGGSYTCSFTVMVTGVGGGVETDIVTASGSDQNQNPVSDSDDASVAIVDIPSQIQVVKTASPDFVTEPGGPVVFSFTIQNLSVVDTVAIESLIDSIYGDLDGQGTCSVPQMLAPGGSYSCSFGAVVSGSVGDSETNVVTASGTDDDGHPVTDTDPATVTVTDLPPEIRLTKSPSLDAVNEPGGLVTFSFVVENLSLVDTVTITSLIDTVFGSLHGKGSCAVPQTIPPVGSYTCSYTTLVAGDGGDSHINAATASGTDDDGQPVSDTDSATVTILDLPSSIQVVKTATPTLVEEPGGVVTFHVQVSNLSVADVVTITTLIDSVHGDLDGQGTCSVPRILAAGTSYACSFAASVTGPAGTTEIDVVSASGADDDGRPVFDDDDAFVQIVKCGDGIVQSGEECDDGNADFGDGCTSSCLLEVPITPICHHPCPSLIRFRPDARDKLYTRFGIAADPAFDPTLRPFKVSLYNSTGLLYSGELLAGDIEKNGRRYQFFDPDAALTGGSRDGIRFLQMSRRPDGLWRFQMKAFADLSTATEPVMTIVIQVGDEVFSVTAPWSQIRNGWKVNFRQVP
jgi:cysteine-rich repeat protein